ncbi:lyso-ornithine lipid acyltransferase [Mycobacterium avium subsp. paratuberculosis S5]|nr:lyso-ornithine lipid acyltransferase [Mycobacterium avium subsp. paratuberculosis S5]
MRRTLARVQVESLQLPGTDRRALAGRCQSAVGVAAARRAGHGRVLVA